MDTSIIKVKRKVLRYVLAMVMMSSGFQLAWAQDTTGLHDLIFFTAQKKRGIYRSFEEFRNNSPSIPLEAQVVERSEYVNIIDGSHEYYRLMFAKDHMPCPKKTAIWGFCDGSSIFISRSSKFRKNNTYDRVIFLGRYIFYISTTAGSSYPMMVPGGMMMMGGGSKSLLEYIIDANTGEKRQLSKKVIEELIKDDWKLSQEFEAEKSKRAVWGNYVMRYAASRVSEIKR